MREVLDDALRGTQTANFEFPLFTKDGDRLDVLLNATTRRDVHGAIVGVVGVGQDITSLKAKENELSNVAADLRAKRYSRAAVGLGSSVCPRKSRIRVDLPACSGVK